ncbi:MAG: hypothetical protein SWH61_07830 [Thermodesulfobacteriota bacterium]|nr:hypothetical protein [Thermodesulfobacteriota bacterium]
MKVAVLHYHLRPGGVTTVIRQQIEATRNDNDFLVLTGENPVDDFPADVQIIPSLGYDREDTTACTSPEDTAGEIINRINRKWQHGCDLVHIHNPFLKKNRQFLKILNALGSRGMVLFLQAHDFAEDGRPNSYFAHDPYPENCHIGVINSRDHSILLDAGGKDAGVHKIANAVTPFPSTPTETEGDSAERIILYPVRAIRRKNIGEAILLSLFFGNNEKLAITLPPNSPGDLPAYEGWKSFVKNNRLNVEFEASSTRDFLNLVANAEAMITTSITEGFGFSFLEPWTAGKPLCGRRIPEICADFENAGIDLSHLYDTIDVPIAWFDKRDLRHKLRQAAMRSRSAFGISPAHSAESSSGRKFIAPFEAMAEADTIDFGFLDESLQKRVMQRLLNSPEDKSALVAQNPFLVHRNQRDAQRVIDQNNQAVLVRFNQSALANRLTKTYQTVTQTPVHQHIDKTRLFERFLTPSNFSLLKWGQYTEEAVDD